MDRCVLDLDKEVLARIDLEETCLTALINKTVKSCG